MADPFRKKMERDFPSLSGTAYAKTSDPNGAYNCIAWAAGEDDRWWEPGFPSDLGYYWPPGARQGGGVAALVDAYKAVGFEPCQGPNFEPGFEKVAVYATDMGAWTHAARQLEDGRWTSKLGGHEDIAHEHPDHLSGQSMARSGATCDANWPRLDRGRG